MTHPELDIAWQECCSGLPREALERVRNFAMQLNAQRDVEAAFRCEWLMGWALSQLGEDEDAFGYALRARLLAERLDDTAKARAEALCAWELSVMGLGDESFSAASLAASIAENCGDDWTLVFALYGLSAAIWLGGDVASAVPVAERGLAAARRLGDTHLESWILICLACMIGDIADAGKAEGDPAAFVEKYEEGIAHTARAFDLAQANSDSWAQRVALANSADFYAYLGRFDEAHRCLDTWKEVGGDIVIRREVHFLEVKAEILRLEGRLDEAREYGEKALSLAERESVVDMIHLCTRVLSEVHEARGEFEIALKLYKNFRRLEIQFESDKVKRRARVATIIYDAEKNRTLAEMERAKAEQSEREAATDPLTGVANRRAMERRFDALLARDGSDFAVIYADLDHFKAVNDRYSHAVGDEVIKVFAKLLQSCCRREDLVARVGGEEFVVLLDQKLDAREAQALCERVLMTMREHSWPEIAPGLSMTTSLGLVHRHEAPGKDALLALADARLYRAKNNGRDCAVTEGCLDSIRDWATKVGTNA
jgi:diguanylate cyclase (GGDEF)-like protein